MSEFHPRDKELIKIMPNGEIFGRWQAVLAYIDWLGNLAALEAFKQYLLDDGISAKEIDEELELYRSFKNKKGNSSDN